MIRSESSGTLFHPPTPTMKYLVMLPLAALAMFSSSCRTNCPLDPLTMRPDCSRCRIAADPSDCCGHHRHETVYVEHGK